MLLLGTPQAHMRSANASASEQRNVVERRSFVCATPPLEMRVNTFTRDSSQKASANGREGWRRNATCSLPADHNRRHVCMPELHIVSDDTTSFNSHLRYCAVYTHMCTRKRRIPRLHTLRREGHGCKTRNQHHTTQIKRSFTSSIRAWNHLPKTNMMSHGCKRWPTRWKSQS